MPATFTPVTLEDFNNLLLASNGWEQDGTAREYVFRYRVRSNPRIVIKVFTSVKTDTQHSREKGTDAIRVVAILLRKDYRDSTPQIAEEGASGLVKSARIHRTAGWEERLKARIIDTISLAKSRTTN